MDTPTYNQYCLQSLDASNTFQDSEGLLGFLYLHTEDKARDKAIEEFNQLVTYMGRRQCGDYKVSQGNYYLFYKGIKGKRLLEKNISFASTNPAYLVGLFAPDSSITSQYLCFVYKYKASDNSHWIYVGKMINKTTPSFYIDKYNETGNQFDYKTDNKTDNKTDTYTKIDNGDNLIKIQDVSNLFTSVKTIVKVKLSPLLCLQSALYVKNIGELKKGHIFLHFFDDIFNIEQEDKNLNDISLNIFNSCCVYRNGKKCIKIYSKYNVEFGCEIRIENARIEAIIKKMKIQKKLIDKYYLKIPEGYPKNFFSAIK